MARPSLFAVPTTPADIPEVQRAWRPASRFSPHALTRLRHRGVNPDGIDAALRWGKPHRQHEGRIAWFLGHRQCCEAARAGEDIARHVGTIVVEAHDGTIVTVVRSLNTRKLHRGAR